MTNATDAPPVTRRRRILVVDDSRSVQQTVHEAFAGMPHVEVDACGDAQAAEEFLTHNTPDLVLCDVVLPGRPGYDLCRQITQSRHDGLPLVFLLSGVFEPFDQTRADSSGADAVITKPFRPEEIRERLEGHLAPDAMIDPAPTTSSDTVEEIATSDLLQPPAEGDFPSDIADLDEEPSDEDLMQLGERLEGLQAADVKEERAPEAQPGASADASSSPQGVVPGLEESSLDELARRMMPALADRLVEPVTELILSRLRETLHSTAAEALRGEAEKQLRQRLVELKSAASAADGPPGSNPESD
jgi:CheY-like chemotaxis protein